MASVSECVAPVLPLATPFRAIYDVSIQFIGLLPENEGTLHDLSRIREPRFRTRGAPAQGT
jgi:hypothetical protein